MADEKGTFDPYRKWLGIPSEQRPPTHYQILGIVDGESDPDVIEEAAIRQTTHLRAYQAGPQRALCAKILKEVANARLTLVDPQRRDDYNRRIGVHPRKTQFAEQPMRAKRAPDKKTGVPASDSKGSRTAKLRKGPNALAVSLAIGGGAVGVVLAGVLAWLLLGRAPHGGKDGPVEAAVKPMVEKQDKKQVPAEPPLPKPPAVAVAIDPNEPWREFAAWRFGAGVPFLTALDGEWAVIGNGGGFANLINVATGERQKFNAPSNVHSACLDGRAVCIPNLSAGKLTAIDFRTGQRTELGDFPAGRYEHMAVAPGNRAVAAQMASGKVVIWRAIPNQTVEINVPKGAGPLAISPDGRFVVVNHNGFTLLDARAKAVVADLPGSGFAKRICFLPDGSMIAARGNEMVAAKPEEGFAWKSVRDLPGPFVHDFDVSADGKWIGAVDSSGKLRLLEWPTLRLVKEAETDSKAPAYSLRFGPFGKTIYVGEMRRLVAYALDGRKAGGMSAQQAARSPVIKPFLGGWVNGQSVGWLRIVEGKLTAHERQEPSGSSSHACEFEIVGNKLRFVVHASEPNPDQWPWRACVEAECAGDTLILSSGPKHGNYVQQVERFRLGSPKAPMANPNHPAAARYVGDWTFNNDSMSIQAEDGQIVIRRKTGRGDLVSSQVHFVGSRLCWQFADQETGNIQNPFCIAEVDGNDLSEQMGPNVHDITATRRFAKAAPANPKAAANDRPSPLGLWANSKQILSLQSVQGRLDGFVMDRESETLAKLEQSVTEGKRLKATFKPLPPNPAKWKDPFTWELTRAGSQLQVDAASLGAWAPSARSFHPMDSGELAPDADAKADFYRAFLGTWSAGPDTLHFKSAEGKIVAALKRGSIEYSGRAIRVGPAIWYELKPQPPAPPELPSMVLFARIENGRLFERKGETLQAAGSGRTYQRAPDAK